MKPMWVNRKATFTDGLLKGKEGWVLAFDSEFDEVTLDLDEVARVVISSDYLEQDD